MFNILLAAVPAVAKEEYSFPNKCVNANHNDSAKTRVDAKALCSAAKGSTWRSFVTPGTELDYSDMDVAWTAPLLLPKLPPMRS